MSKNLIGAIIIAATLGGCLTGCVSEGHRKVSVELFGSTFSWEDQTFPNQKGELLYRNSFDDAWNKPLIDWFVGPPEPTNDSVADSTEG